MVKSKKTPSRLTRKAWLDKALEVLRREGNPGLQIDNITNHLGVTKGSFYWHFTNRTDFRKAILDYWEDVYNRGVIAKAQAHGGTAQQRLRVVIEQVTKGNLSEYDEPIDGWAAHEPEIGIRVQRVYDQRYDYMRLLFSELGFKGVELETRIVACLGLLKCEWTMPPGNFTRPTKGRIDAWMRFLTKP